MTFDDPIPFDEAIAFAQRKGILPTTLSSAQLSRLKAMLKQRAVFSARMNSVQVLQVLQKNLQQLVSGAGIEEENGRIRSVAEAKAQLREAMVEAGVRFADEDTPTIKDFYSDKRRDLMVRTTLLDTLNAGRHIASQDPVALDLNPGLELVRMVVPKGGEAAERDWIQRWHDAMDEIGDDADHGCTDPDDAGGRMVALVNHPIWQALGDGAGGYEDTLGNAWAPFAFNSGMNTIAVPRGQCVALGIMDEDERVQPDDDIDINEDLQASVGKFDSALQDALKGGGLKIVKGILKIANRRQVSVARLSIKKILQLQEAA
jgi:hypothetical protein